MTVFAFWFDSNKEQHYPFLGTRVIRRARFFNDIHDPGQFLYRNYDIIAPMQTAIIIQLTRTDADAEIDRNRTQVYSSVTSLYNYIVYNMTIHRS